MLAGRADEAEPLLARLVRREATHGRDVEQARALVDLGHAHHDQDRAENALPLWREAAGLFEAHGQWEDAARTLLAAGALVNRERDERTRPSALDLFERAVAAARQAVDEDPAVLPAALHAHGYLLCESGQAEGLDLLEEALALVRDAGADWQVADYTDTRARALWSLERGPEAIATALQAADLFTAAGDREGAAQAELFAAYVVAEDGSPEQAATLFLVAGLAAAFGAGTLSLAGWSLLFAVAGLAGLRALAIRDRARRARPAAVVVPERPAAPAAEERQAPPADPERDRRVLETVLAFETEAPRPAAPAAPRVEPVVVTASSAAPAADRAVTIPAVPRPTYLDAPEMARPLPAPLETPAPTGADTRPQDAARTADDQISAAAEQDIAALDLDNVLARRRAC